MRPAYLPLTAPLTDYVPPTPPDLARYDTVYLDTETTGTSWARGDRPVGIAVGTPDGHTWYLPFGHRGGGNLAESTVHRWAMSELRAKRVVGLNIKFDLHMLRMWGVDLRDRGCTFHDIAHAEALLDDHARGFSLEAIAQRRLGIGKLDAGPKANIAAEHASLIAPYAERDVALPHRIDEIQRPLLAAEGLERVAAIEDGLIPAVIEMEAHGAPLDMDLLEQWERTSRRLLDRLQHQLAAEAGFAVNPDSPADLARLFLKCGVPIARRTATGKPSFPAEWVSTIEHPLIRQAYRIGKLIDLRNKYLVKYLQDAVDGVLYPSFHQLMTDEGGTVSGRFSCVRPNLQQVMGADKHARAYGWLLEHGPEDYLVKRLFRPAPGATWLAADAKQIEYRIFAHYANSPTILRRYAADVETDFHNIVRDLVVTARPSITRTEVKTFNFLKIYGGGVGAAATNLGVDEHTASEISDAYDAQFPEAKGLLLRAKGLAERRGYVKTLTGRRSRFPGRERTHKALNAVIQGTAADINKLVLTEAYTQRTTLGLTMRLTVHDELDADLHDPARLPAVRDLLNAQYLPTRVPVLWDVNTGGTWAEAK